MARRLMLGLDQGTGSSRAILVDRRGRVHGQARAPVGRTHHRDGSIDQDAGACLRSLRRAVRLALDAGRVHPDEVEGLGLAVQRSTCLLYGSAKGPVPLTPAISWQCGRTGDWMRSLPAKSLRALERRSGLPANPTYAASKLRWLDRHLPRRGRPADWRAGTLDSFLAARLGRSGRPVSDLGTATRTLLVELGQRRWSARALARFELDGARLPEIVDSLGEFDRLRAGALPGVRAGTPMLALAGDQPAALYAGPARATGAAKITYGSGAFLLSPAGPKLPPDAPGLLRSVAWSHEGRIEFLLEGNVPSAGTVFQWLEELCGRDTATLLRRAGRADWDRRLGALSFLPAFAGLGPLAPQVPRGGALLGLHHDVRAEDLAEALAAAIAAALAEALDAAAALSPRRRRSPGLIVDGGGSRDRAFLQLQADVLQRSLLPTREAEATAYGAAALAWAATGIDAPRLATARPVTPRLPRARARRLRERFLADLARWTAPPRPR